MKESRERKGKEYVEARMRSHATAWKEGRIYFCKLSL
jgi:hypothetical protein